MRPRRCALCEPDRRAGCRRRGIASAATPLREGSNRLVATTAPGRARDASAVDPRPADGARGATLGLFLPPPPCFFPTPLREKPPGSFSPPRRTDGGGLGNT